MWRTHSTTAKWKSDLKRAPATILHKHWLRLHYLLDIWHLKPYSWSVPERKRWPANQSDQAVGRCRRFLQKTKFSRWLEPVEENQIPHSSTKKKGSQQSWNWIKCLQKKTAIIKFTELVETTFWFNCVLSRSSFMSEKTIKAKALLEVTADAPSLLELIHVLLVAIVDTSTEHYYESLQCLLKRHKNLPSKLTPNDPHKKWGAFLDSELPYRLPAVCGDNTQRLLPLWIFKRRLSNKRTER